MFGSNFAAIYFSNKIPEQKRSSYELEILGKKTSVRCRC